MSCGDLLLLHTENCWEQSQSMKAEIIVGKCFLAIPENTQDHQHRKEKSAPTPSDVVGMSSLSSLIVCPTGVPY